MQIKLSSVIVDDQGKALKFYTEVLGFFKTKAVSFLFDEPRIHAYLNSVLRVPSRIQFACAVRLVFVVVLLGVLGCNRNRSLAGEREQMERLFHVMQNGRFTVAPLGADWRLAMVAGKNGLVRWRKDDAAIEMSYYSDMTAESVLRDVSGMFQVTSEPESRLELRRYPTSAISAAGAVGPILNKYVVVPSATAPDVITFTYMEKVGLAPLGQADAVRIAARSPGVKAFDELVQSLRPLSEGEMERAREALSGERPARK